MSEFQQATQFQLEELKIDGKDVKPMFFSVECYENIFISAITGNVTLVDTSSNQMLQKMNIEGNEKIEWRFKTSKGVMEFQGHINRVHDKIISGTGGSVYSFEFASPVVRANEMSYLSRSFTEKQPKDVVEDCLKVLNENSDIEIKTDTLKGDGKKMRFVTARWHPIRTINYAQKKGVPYRRGGDSTASNDTQQRECEGKGASGFLFWETLKGVRFGSDLEVLAGEVGQKVEDKFSHQLQNRGGSMEYQQKSILDFDVVQNNDTQTQNRSGSFQSRLVSFDLDKLQYKEQTWESEFATEKQKETAKKPTRYFSKMFSNERWENKPDKAQRHRYDQSREYLQQGEGMANNMTDGVARFTLPLRSDLNAGDLINTTVFEPNAESETKYDKKFSGNWIISGVAHHYRLEGTTAHTRLTCIRATNQNDESSSSSVSTV
jgi:hypothetical protein